MSFFKKIVSRSRSNSSSYVDDEYDRDNSGAPPGSRDQYDPNLPPSSWKYDEPQYPQSGPPASGAPYERTSRNLDGPEDSRVYRSPETAQQTNFRPSQPTGRNSNTNSAMMTGRSSRDGFVDVPSMTQQLPPTVTGGSQPQNINHSKAPDLLTQAFNAAIAPYADKIAGLEEQIADLQAFVDQLEQNRLDVFAWIDKRGLRPDLPPAVAKQIDSQPGLNNMPPAEVLNSQLDRKITIVNFDLHRLQDDLNDSITSSHFAASMSKFLPDVQRLAGLPGGPRFAYDLIIKLVGNLNSHGGVDRDGGNATDEDIEEDRRARADFGDRMDEELIDVVRRRVADNESWDVQKEVRRFERNAAYLKNIGFESYFPRTLEVLKREAGGSGGATGSTAYNGATQSASYGGSGTTQPGAYSGAGTGATQGYGGNGNSIGVGGQQRASPPQY